MIARSRSRVLLIVLSVLAPLLVVASVQPATAEPGAAAAETAIETYQRSRPVAPGVTLEQVETLDAKGWQQGNVLTIDTGQGARIDYLGSKDVTTIRPIAEQADEAGAVAAINGDFFDINNSGAPLGPAIDDGELLKSQSEDPYRVAGFDANGVGRVLEVLFEGTATLPSGPITLDRLNSPLLKADEVEAFTSLWGASPRGRAVQGAEGVVEVTITDGVVQAVSDEAGEGAVPAGTTILLGREAGAERLRALRPGDRVEVAYRPRPSDGGTVHAAVGVHELLVEDGKARPIEDPSYAGRTGLGFSKDGKTITIVTVDSDRQTHSRGATLAELGRLLDARGAWVGVELDGGGSSTLVSRRPGAAKVQVDNTPGDGFARPVANGLGVMAPKGSGEVVGFWLETAASPRTAASDSPVAGKARPDRVFSGLTRTVTAKPHDETYGPAAATDPVRWSTNRGLVSGGVFHATDPGRATITARSGRAEGSLDLEVLGPPARLATTAQTVNVPSVNEPASFGLLGYDAFGASAPIEATDVTLDYDRSLFEISAPPTGGSR